MGRPKVSFFSRRARSPPGSAGESLTIPGMQPGHGTFAAVDPRQHRGQRDRARQLSSRSRTPECQTQVSLPYLFNYHHTAADTLVKIEPGELRENWRSWERSGGNDKSFAWQDTPRGVSVNPANRIPQGVVEATVSGHSSKETTKYPDRGVTPASSVFPETMQPQSRVGDLL